MTEAPLAIASVVPYSQIYPQQEADIFNWGRDDALADDDNSFSLFDF